MDTEIITSFKKLTRFVWSKTPEELASMVARPQMEPIVSGQGVALLESWGIDPASISALFADIQASTELDPPEAVAYLVAAVAAFVKVPGIRAVPWPVVRQAVVAALRRSRADEEE